MTSASAQVLGLDLPPEGERLVASQEVAQATFAMWDLIHDRTHSHGDLPFDPFMIKQRMPFGCTPSRSCAATSTPSGRA